MPTSFEEGDAPEVRDLLLAHFRDPELEVEGKLGRRSKDRFVAGVSAEQFAALEARLLAGGAPCLGLTRAAPVVEVTIDRFHAIEPRTAAVASSACAGSAVVLAEPLEDGGDGQAPAARRPPRRRPSGVGRHPPTVRSSYAVDGGGHPVSEPFEVLKKMRLSDCHIGRQLAEDEPPHALVDLRVSFSRERALQPEFVTATGLPMGTLIHERVKRRHTFAARLWRVQLTHVTGEGREAFEVEVELDMTVVRTRLDSAVVPADEALAITRELVAALRVIARWAADIPISRKRKRLEDFEAVDRALKSALEEPEVDAELRRRIREGPRALKLAKKYLCEWIRLRLASVDESALHRLAGRQVAKAMQRQQRAAKDEPDADMLLSEQIPSPDHQHQPPQAHPQEQ